MERRPGPLSAYGVGLLALPQHQMTATTTRKLPLQKAAVFLALEMVILTTLGIWLGYRFFWKHYPSPPRRQLQLERARLEVQRYPEDYRAWVNLGYAHYELGEWAEAEKAYLRAQRLNPQAAWIHYFLGLVYYQRGEWEKAADHLARVIKAYPDSLLPRYQIALVYHRQGKNKEALRELDEVKRLDPYLADAYTLTGQVYEAEGKREVARDNYLRALKLNPLDEEAREAMKRMEREGK
jgi:tetratricopeptide (TPR) repeat protein